MKSYLLAAIAVSVLALTGATCSLLLTVQAAVKALPVELARQGDLLRVQSLAEIDLQATALQKSANAQLTVIRKDTVAQAAAFAGIADRQLTGARSDLKQTVAESVKTVVAPLEGLRSDLQPVLANAGTLTKTAADLTQQIDDQAPMFLDCEYNPDCVFNRFQGTSKAIEKAAVSTSSAMAEVNRDLPVTVAGLDKIVANSDRATDATAKLMGNMAESTKPLPKYVRVPLSILGLLAPSIAGAITGYMAVSR
jgi:hypothetical protein